MAKLKQNKTKRFLHSSCDPILKARKRDIVRAVGLQDHPPRLLRRLRRPRPPRRPPLRPLRPLLRPRLQAREPLLRPLLRRPPHPRPRRRRAPARRSRPPYQQVLEVMVVAIHNISGLVQVDNDGNWTCPSDKKHKHDVIPNPVLQVNRLAANLQSYLEQRGAKLPDGHITGRVVLPNPNCRPSYAITLQPEVILYDQWKDVKADSKGGLSTWIKGAFSGSKGDMQDSLLQNLHSILSTSPMWDRLELKGDRNILGEFIEFKGRHDDIQALKCLKRSKVCRFIVQKSTLFGGFGRSRVQILYSPRDYRAEGTSSSEWKEISVKQYTEILFQPLHSKKVKKFKLSSVASVTLSA